MKPNAFMTVIVAVCILVVGWAVVSGVQSEELQRYVDQSESWCEQHGGELVNSQVIGPHGGLHCELPNGTMVHMSEVPEDQLEAAAENRSS